MSRRSTATSISVNQSSLRDYLSLRLREGFIILIIAAALYLLLSLLTYHPTDPGWSHYISVKKVANAGGRVGAWIADLLLFFCGYWAYMLPFLLGYAAWLIYRHRMDRQHSINVKIAIVGFRSLGLILLSVAASGLVSAYLPNAGEKLPDHAGGVLGQVALNSLTNTFNFSGCVLILVAFFLIGITLFTGLSWVSLCEQLGQAIFRIVPQVIGFVYRLRLKFKLGKTEDLPVAPTKVPSSARIAKTRIEPLVPIVKITDEDEAETISAPITSRVSRLLKPRATQEVASESNLKEVRKARLPLGGESKHSNVLPELSLLNAKNNEQTKGATPQELEQRSREVEAHLADFGVHVQVVAVYPGPVVTRFEVQLAAGTKVSKISSLSKDLARSLSVVSVRVVEVIPGKSVIGIELPNPDREMVTLQEVLASKAYTTSRSVLSLALGKDISGHPVVVDLGKMPHLLVAGTTGSGKSVSLNTMLLSLLYKASPDQLRLIMIDPKMLELSVYDGIPHLLTPVVTDMKDAATVLRWCVVEMERRYRLMASLGVRNIMGYNAKIREASIRGTPILDPFSTADGDPAKPLPELPMIVVLADEFADMMVVVGKKVETLIARLAQKARAAGVHLILATQRPSVDVITGLIKANIPTRIAFQVSSKVDSRTILDQQGAEQLLGHGDMLYLAPGTGVPVRVHGAFVSDDEVHRVVSSLKEQGQPEYIDDLLDESSGVDTSGYTEGLFSDEDMENDPLYDEALHMVTKTRRVSVSSIQRRFKIGYNRAARIVEAMEKAGAVSKMEGNGTREVLAPPTAE